MKKIFNKEKNDNKTNLVYIITSSIFIVILLLVIFLMIRDHSEQCLVQNSVLEKTELATSYVVKTERTIEKDQSKVLIPIIAEGAKTSKKGIIATYKGKEYENFEETLENMDKEILKLMKDLPTVYSSEVDAIDKTVYELVKSSIGEGSYIKMQEYKQKINNSINKRATIIGDLSPAGADIKRLISERNTYETNTKKSNDNVLAPISGIVSYKIDGLESKLNAKDISKLKYTEIRSMVKNNKNGSTTGIKVANNYEAYIVTKLNLENLGYIKKGYMYKVRLIEDSNYEFRAELIDMIEKEDGVEVYFKICNGIEELVNLREVEIEIVLSSDAGLMIPISAINQKEGSDVSYVTIIRYTEYIDIPIHIKMKNEKYAIVSNYTTEELKELNIKNDDNLELFDKIMIKSND